ncbi:MAG: HORMA domain containing protein [Anaerolineales bacterium]|nr:HORMA domain containing protein [Anaerolineales bacterium]
MSTFVAVNTYTHAVTYVSNKLLLSLQSIIKWSGLNPAKIADDWTVLERGIRTWLDTQDLTGLVLEVCNPVTGALVGRWDIDIRYGYTSTADGSFWVNTDDIQYHIKKAGVWPSSCEYRVVATTKPGRPDVQGWSRTTFRSTEGFVKQSLGTTLDARGLSGAAGYWRKA